MAYRRVEVSLPRESRGKLAFILEGVYTPDECAQMVADTERVGYEPAKIDVGGGAQEVASHVRNNDRCMIDAPEQAAELFRRLRGHIPAQWENRPVVGINERLRFLRYHPGQRFRTHYDLNYVRANGECSQVTVHLYLNDVAAGNGGTTRFIDSAAREAAIAAQAAAQPSYNPADFESEDEYEEDGEDGSALPSVRTKFVTAGDSGSAPPSLPVEYIDESVDVIPKAGSVLIFQHDILHCGSELLAGIKYTLRTDVMYASNPVPASPS